MFSSPMLRLLSGVAIPLSARGCGALSVPTRTEHLLPKAAVVRTKANETRPSITLAPGETFSAKVSLSPSSQACFAWGQEPGPSRGVVHLTVRLDSAIVYESKPARVGNTLSFRADCVPLEGEGEGTLEFRADHTRWSGEPLPPADRDDSRWITLSSIRVCPRRSPEGRVFVWISQDTVRADHVGAYGYRRHTTPAFDHLAEGSIVFDSAVAPASWTLPSLTSLFTSRYPSFHGAVAEQGIRNPQEPTIFDVLSAEGFTVLGVTGNRFVSDEFHLASGFDALWYLGEGHRADELTQLALRSLDEWPGGDLCLFIHYMDPHFPYEPPPPFDRKFDPSYQGRANGRNFEQYKAKGSVDVRHVEALYDGELAFTDSQIGVLLESLGARGLLQNAVVLYSADHGEEFLDHGGWTHSRTVYEEVLHIPLAVRIPGLGPRRIHDVVSGVDVAPTILEAYGIPRPPSFQGRSLGALLSGSHAQGGLVFAETEHTLDHKLRIAVRSGSTKYILVTPRGREVPPPILREELFDLERDPAETTPLKSRDLQLRGAALAYLEKARESAPGGGQALLSDETKRVLRSLGYLD